MYKAVLTLIVAALSLSFLPALAQQDNPPHLRQRNPAREAPASVNTSNPDIWDAYPWFNRDGKLLFWTRESSATSIAKVWVAYIRNRGQVINTTAGQTLPALNLSPIKKLPGAWNDGQTADETIKAIAYCRQSFQDNTPDANHMRYTFTLFYSTGPQGARVIYRIPNLVIDIDKSIPGQETIDSMSAPSAPQILGSSVNVAGKNSTEPMLTRDGRFLFWASNASSFSPMARYIEVSQACTQLNQASSQYSDLPSNRFAWVDQYVTGANYDRTRSTNYHTVLEKGSIANSQTALIFERCNELQRVRCADDLHSRYCDCVSTDDSSVPLNQRYGVLMSTGFEAGEEPAPILGCFNPALNQDYPGRDTHPAISGPPTPGGTWLLFFMRGKKVWYTTIGECPASGTCGCT